MNQARRTIDGLALPALLLTLLLFVGQAASRSSTDNEGDIASLPSDADNVEFHHVKMVNGVMQEDHPVIMYKEDFVDENYDPSKNETKVNHHKKYKHLKHHQRHHHTRPSVESVAVGSEQEKIVFDVLPETPILIGDEDDFVQPSKEESLQKYPKKYHSRQRRQAPYPNKNNYYARHQFVQYPQVPAPYYLPVQPQHQRYPVAGKKPTYLGKLPRWQTKKPATMPIDIGNRDNFGDDNNLFHNSNPDDADFSIFDQPRPDQQVSGGGSGNNDNNQWQSPPVQEANSQPNWGPSTGRRPNNAPTLRPVPPLPTRPQSTSRPAWSAPTATQRPALRPLVTEAPVQRPTTKKVSNCVWAIVNCCSQDSNKIRYNCFEDFGCHGAFWGVNPCADRVRDGVIASLS